MKRIEEFETKVEELIKSFSDIPYEDLADSLEYYYIECKTKANMEEN